jgi:hypothetical protein
MHSGATAARSNITVTVRCTVAIASASIGAHVFRGAVDRLFHDAWGSDFILQLVLSTLVLSVFWFSLVFVFLKFGRNDSWSNASASAFSEQNLQLMSTHPLNTSVVCSLHGFSFGVNRLGRVTNERCCFLFALIGVDPTFDLVPGRWVQRCIQTFPL